MDEEPPGGHPARREARPTDASPDKGQIRNRQGAREPHGATTHGATAQYRQSAPLGPGGRRLRPGAPVPRHHPGASRPGAEDLHRHGRRPRHQDAPGRRPDRGGTGPPRPRAPHVGAHRAPAGPAHYRRRDHRHRLANGERRPRRPPDGRGSRPPPRPRPRRRARPDPRGGDRRGRRPRGQSASRVGRRSRHRPRRERRPVLRPGLGPGEPRPPGRAGGGSPRRQRRHLRGPGGVPPRCLARLAQRPAPDRAHRRRRRPRPRRRARAGGDRPGHGGRPPPPGRPAGAVQLRGAGPTTTPSRPSRRSSSGASPPTAPRSPPRRRAWGGAWPG